MGQFTFLNGRPPARGLIWAGLSDTTILQKPTATSDSGGGASASWANAGTFACRIDPLAGASSRLTGGQINERSTHVVTVGPGAAVDPSYRVVIANRGTFDVTGVRSRTGALSTVFEVVQI